MRRSLHGRRSVCELWTRGAAFAQTPKLSTQWSADAILRCGDCAACHSAPGGAPFAGGVALQTPFGTLVAPNITSDPDTGIGNMTNDEFLANCMRAADTAATALPRDAYPCLYQNDREDALAMRAYFATVAPAPDRINQPVAVPLEHPLDWRYGTR